MSDRFRHLDDLDRYLDALEAVSELVLQCGSGNATLSEVEADKLGTLLWIVLEGAQTARDGLRKQLHA